MLLLEVHTSILGEVRNIEIPGPTQQLLCRKSHDFLAVFPLAHSKINQIIQDDGGTSTLQCTGGNLTDSPEPATFSCADSLLEITIEPARQTYVM